MEEAVRRHFRDVPGLLHPVQQRPIVFAACAHAVGIAAGVLGGWALAGITLAAATLVAVRWPTHGRGWGAVCGLGALIGALSHNLLLGEIPKRATYANVSGTVASPISETDGRIRCLLATERIAYPDGSTSRIRGVMVVSLPTKPHEQPPAYGDRVFAHGLLAPPEGERNPEGYSQAAYLMSHSVCASLRVRHPARWRIAARDVRPMSRLIQAAHALRSEMLGFFSRTSGHRAGLLTGVILGGREGVSPALEDAFRSTGTSHILAASGMNVMIVAAMVLALSRLGAVHARSAAVAAISACGLYSLAAGAQPSVMRAFVMSAFFLAAPVLGREPDGHAAIAASSLVLLTIDPHALLDPGFQLSYAVVIGLMLVGPLIVRANAPRSKLSVGARVCRSGIAAILASVTAQAFAGPLIAQHFHSLSMTGLVANALMVPIVGVLLCGGLLAYGVSLVSPAAADIAVALVLEPASAFMAGAALVASRLPYASIAVRAPGWPLITVYYVCLIVAVLHVRARAPASPIGLAGPS